MSIPFVQFLLPDGRQTETSIDRPPEIEEMAGRLLAAGCRLEYKVLRTGEVSLTVELEIDDQESTLAIEVVPNGPDVGEAVDRLIRTAFDSLEV